MIRTTVVGLPLVFLMVASGCVSALPEQNPVAEIAEYARRTDQAAAAAKAYADQAREDLQRAEELLKEARMLRAQSEEGQRRCLAVSQENSRLLSKLRSCQVKKKSEAAAETAAAPAAAAASPTPSPTQEELYSPSDAPM